MISDAPGAIGPYEQAIKANGFVFVSGCIPLIPTSMEVVEGGFEAQLKQVLSNLTAVVEASGSSLDKVVKTTVSCRSEVDDGPWCLFSGQASQIDEWHGRYSSSRWTTLQL